MTLSVIGLFCEDIREEKSGQHTLIGLMPDNVNVPKPPEAKNARAIIPKLGLFVRVNMDPDDSPGPMNLSLVLTDGTELPLSTITEELIATSKKEALEKGLPLAGLMLNTVMQGFQIPGLGILTAVLTVDGHRHTCAIIKFTAEEKAATAT